MKIGIIGAGNLGTAIAADLGRYNDVRIFSSNPDLFLDKLTYKDIDSINEWQARINFASNSYEKVVSNCELIFIVVPTFMIKSVIANILPHIKKNAIIGFVPGAGGVEFLAKDAIKQGFTIFGFERVPYIARLEKYGEIVLASKKSKYRIATIPNDKANEVSTIIRDLFNRPCCSMSDFISITLTPSLHASRLYDLYKNYILGEELDDNPFFYKDWRDSASYLVFEMDSELHKVCDALIENRIGASDVIPYCIHYESATPELLTKKLSSIKSLANIKGPLIHKGNGKFVLDIKSRYFTESYPYRLCIVKGFADIFGINVPKTDEVIKWYEHLANKRYYVNDKFEGKDVIECNIPQNYGINRVDELYDFYN